MMGTLWQSQDDIIGRLEGQDTLLTGLNLWVALDNDTDYARLGRAIGRSSHLTTLEVNFSERDEQEDACALFRELARNSSIRNLTLNYGSSRRDDLFLKALTAFTERKESLASISLSSCDWRNGDGGLGNLIPLIRTSVNLKSISIRCSRLRGESLHQGEFIPAVKELRRLKNLDLGNNSIRNVCELIAPLLEDPDSKLRTLILDHSDIDDDGAAVLANSLVDNDKLECLDLKHNPRIRRGWVAFAKVLCDASSVNATHSSNHTLKSLGVSLGRLPTDLFYNLTLNHGPDKGQVARKKILWKHPHLDMEPFFEWGLKMLPVAMVWFERARDLPRRNDATYLSSMYQFVRVMSEAFGPDLREKKGRRKRKRDPR